MAAQGLATRSRQLVRRALCLLVLPAWLLAGCASPPADRAFVPAAPAATAVKKPLKIGLALGGGAARGFAHVGVIAVLEEAGLRPQLVVGTSAGSLVAGRLIENMSIPLGIVATDLNSGQAVLFQRGDTGTAVRASSAVPAVFVPVVVNGHEYVDGGLVSPVPVRFARQMGAELVIAVDISSPPEGNPSDGTLQILLQTFAIMGKSINQYELKDAEIVVRPSLAGLKSADFSARQRAIDSGRAAMLAALPALKARLASGVALAH